jgi:hypothetical protein
MEEKNNIIIDKNVNANYLINKLAKSNDIQAYENKIMNYIEENNKRILVSIKNDKKTYLLLMRTYYLNEFNKIEKIIDLLNKNYNLTNETYLQLLSFLNLLLKFEEIYINKFDVLKSLQLQSKIINIIKQFIINKKD